MQEIGSYLHVWNVGVALKRSSSEGEGGLAPLGARVSRAWAIGNGAYPGLLKDLQGRGCNLHIGHL